MAIQYANMTYSYVVDNLVDLPAGVPPGQLAYVVNTAKAYYSTNGTWKEVGLGVTGGYQPYIYSFDNPPASAGTYDDEFNSTSLNAAWTLTSTGTTNPCVSGTVNPISSLTTPVYDLTTWPGWLLVQSDNSSVQTVSFSKTISLGTDATFFAKVGFDNRNFSASGEGDILFNLYNNADTNEEVSAYIQEASGAAFRYRLRVNNNGAVTEVTGGNIVEQTAVSPYYIALWKSGNSYYAGFTAGGTVFTVVGPVTKTGTTTLDRLELSFHTANETPSAIMGVDFIRYYSSVTYALRN